MTIPNLIEAILFYKAEPVTTTALGKMLNSSEESIETALRDLETGLAGRGLVLVRAGDTVELRTSPDAANTLEAIRLDELSGSLGKAGAEVLAIILYSAPVSRARIDYIRGVNSTFTLRALTVRGLVERIQNKDNQRGFLYQPTIDLLSHLGITQVADLPDYALIAEELARHDKIQHETNEKPDTHNDE